MWLSLSLASLVLDPTSVQASASQAAQQPAQPPTIALTSYPEAVRCAGLTQAASELEGGESDAGRRLYDAALYWSLTAIQAAEASGRPGRAIDADQTRARVQAVRQLSADVAEARTGLQRCLARVPDLG